MTETAIYIGAGTDFKPTYILPEVKYFIYVDTNEKKLSPEEYENKVLEKANKNNFKLHKKKNSLIVLKNDEKKTYVLYFYNCDFPKDLVNKKFKKIVDYMKNAKYLINIGFSADEVILNYLPKKFWYIMHYNTVYGYYREDEKTINNYFLDRPKSNRLYGCIYIKWFNENCNFGRTIMFKDYEDALEYHEELYRKTYGSDSDSDSEEN